MNIEQAIADWRRQMAAGGVKNPGQLDELESHVREDIRALVSAGMPDAEAVPLALSRVGRPGLLRAEFDKVSGGKCWPVRIGSMLWLVLAVMMMLVSLVLAFRGKWEFLLVTHVFCVTAGYFAGFVAGGFGACYVIFRFFRSLPVIRQDSLVSAAGLFVWIAAVLVIAGALLGMVWSRQHYGAYVLGDQREMAALCVVLWFLALPVMRRASRISERAMMLWVIGGNIMVSLAWFGPFILSGRMPNYVPIALSIFVGIHIVFLVLGAAPVPAARGDGPQEL